ncbi:MAG TPA: hypothetical protein VFC09_09755 [Candidatus Dormibacteraeota bacterium]|nr:hypothetical protein [Candidatus Dormibacteraeota bacterium]
MDGLRASGRSPGHNAQHLILEGGSQMGKTGVAIELLRPLRNLVIVDTKHEGEFDALGPVTEDPLEVLRRPVCIFHPPRVCLKRWKRDWSDPWSLLLHYVLTVRARTGVTLYVDELRTAMPLDPHPLLADAVTEGMGKGVGVWGGTQGPSGVFPPMLDFAVWWLLFCILPAQQRGVIQSSIGVQVFDELADLERFQFLLWRQGWKHTTGPWTRDDVRRAIRGGKVLETAAAPATGNGPVTSPEAASGNMFPSGDGSLRAEHGAQEGVAEAG